MPQKLVLILSFVVLGFHSNAQDAVTWSTAKEKVEEEGNTYLIIFHANIADSWHLYSQELSGNDNYAIPVNLSSGIYMVSLQTSAKIKSTKVFIK